MGALRTVRRGFGDFLSCSALCGELCCAFRVFPRKLITSRISYTHCLIFGKTEQSLPALCAAFEQPRRAALTARCPTGVPESF